MQVDSIHIGKFDAHKARPVIDNDTKFAYNSFQTAVAKKPIPKGTDQKLHEVHTAIGKLKYSGDNRIQQLDCLITNSRSEVLRVRQAIEKQGKDLKTKTPTLEQVTEANIAAQAALTNTKSELEKLRHQLDKREVELHQEKIASKGNENYKNIDDHRQAIHDMYKRLLTLRPLHQDAETNATTKAADLKAHESLVKSLTDLRAYGKKVEDASNRLRDIEGHWGKIGNTVADFEETATLFEEELSPETNIDGEGDEEQRVIDQLKFLQDRWKALEDVLSIAQNAEKGFVFSCSQCWRDGECGVFPVGSGPEKDQGILCKICFSVLPNCCG
jgi:chromosome segregation ATPase